MKKRSLYVRDTELLVKKGIPKICYIGMIHKEKWRLTDGVQHPVTTRRVTPEEMEKLWKQKQQQLCDCDGNK